MKPKITTELIEDKLFSLYEEYGKHKEDFDNIEREYTLLKAQSYMRQDVFGLGTQVLRDAQVEAILQDTETGKKYFDLKTKMDEINMGIRIWNTIARLHMSWKE